MKTYILLLQCKDRKGIVAKVTEFIFKSGGNIVTLDQYSSNPEGGHFFMRVEFTLKGTALSKNNLERRFIPVAGLFRAKIALYDKNMPLRMGVLVSKPDHCLADILYLYKRQELNVDIPFVVSNFSKHKELVSQYKVPFYFVSSNSKDRKEKDTAYCRALY